MTWPRILLPSDAMGLPHTGPERRSGTAAPIILHGLKDRMHPTEYPWISLKHPDRGPPPERGTCSDWNVQGFILGWYVGPRWDVSTGLRDRDMGWLALRGSTPSQPTRAGPWVLRTLWAWGEFGASVVSQLSLS